MLGRVFEALAILLVALVVIALVVLVSAIGAAGVLLAGRLLGGLFGIAVFEAAAITLGIALALGLTLVWLLARPSRSPLFEIGEGVVPEGRDEPEKPHYEDSGDAHCPNCGQALDVPPPPRAERRRRQ